MKKEFLTESWLRVISQISPLRWPQDVSWHLGTLMDCKTTTCSWHFLKVERHVEKNPMKQGFKETKLSWISDETHGNAWILLRAVAWRGEDCLNSCQPMDMCKGIFWSWVCSLEGRSGHAVNTQGVRSQKCCGESPRALGQRVPLGDQKAETLEQTAMLHAELWFWAFGPLQLQSYAVSICKNANRTGLTLFMLSFCSSATRGFSRGILLSSAMLTDVWVSMNFSIFSNAPSEIMETHDSAEGSRLTWRRIVEFMSTYGHLQGDFWSWVCSLEGRRSTATQWTHKEFAPKNAAGKVPVPWGRECHWETRRPKPWNRQRCATCGVVVLGVWPFATAQLCREHLQKCQQNGAHSLHALLLHPFMYVEFSHKTWKLALEIFRMVECRWNLDIIFHNIW